MGWARRRPAADTAAPHGALGVPGPGRGLHAPGQRKEALWGRCGGRGSPEGQCGEPEVIRAAAAQKGPGWAWLAPRSWWPWTKSRAFPGALRPRCFPGSWEEQLWSPPNLVGPRLQLWPQGPERGRRWLRPHSSGGSLHASNSCPISSQAPLSPAYWHLPGSRWQWRVLSGEASRQTWSR